MRQQEDWVLCRRSSWELLLLLFVILYAIDPSTSIAATNQQYLYWRSGRQILRSNLDGSGVVKVAEADNNFGQFVFDLQNQSIYVSTAFEIRQLDLDGGNSQVLYTFPTFASSSDLALDHLRGLLYFSDGRNNAIYRMNVDGTAVETIIAPSGIPSNITGIGRIQLDLANDKLYWADRQSDSISLFRRSNLDGSGVETMFSTQGFGVRDFALDVVKDMVYWGQASIPRGQGTIRRAKLDGTEMEILVSGLWGPSIELDLAQGRMYFSDTWLSGPTAYDGTIRVADLDGTDVNVLINFGPNHLIHPGRLTLGPLIPEPKGIELAFSWIAGVILLRRRTNQTAIGFVKQRRYCRDIARALREVQD